MISWILYIYIYIVKRDFIEREKNQGQIQQTAEAIPNYAIT